MSVKQNDTGHQEDSSQAEPSLPEPEVLTFSMPIPFDGFVYLEGPSDSGMAA